MFFSRRVPESGNAGYASGVATCAGLAGGLANQEMVDPVDNFSEAFSLLGGSGVNFRVNAKYRCV